MLSGSKKIQNSGQDWFVVLNPLKSEFERNKIVKGIAAAFNLPVEEAFDLVANTPIILLDSLLYTTALQLKQYFRNVNTDILVSNDNLLKRRCYRTVWPTPPNLSFLHSMDPKGITPKAEEQKLDQEEAIQEIRSWVQTEGSSIEHDRHGQNKNGLAPQRHFRSLLEEEREKLLKENVGFKEDIQQLRKALEKTQAEVSEKEKIVQVYEAAKKQKEKEVQELQSLLGHAEEKYEILREEFRQTRQYLEEKSGSQEKKTEEFLRQIEDRELANKELLQEKQALLKSFHAVKSDIQKNKEEYEQIRREWESQVNQLNHELENQKKTINELNAKIQNLEEGKRIVQTSELRLMKELESQTQQTKRWEAKASELEKEIRRLRDSFENQLQSWQLRLAQLESREHELDKARKQIRQLHGQLEQRELIQRKNQLHEQLTVKEARLKSLVKQQEKIETEIRDHEEEMQKLLSEQEVLEREIIEAKQTQRHLAERFKRENLAQDHSEDLTLPSPPSDVSPLRPHSEALDD